MFNSNGRNHREHRVINDGNSAVSYIGHVDLAPVGRNSDAPWGVPDGNVVETHEHTGDFKEW